MKRFLTFLTLFVFVCLLCPHIAAACEGVFPLFKGRSKEKVEIQQSGVVGQTGVPAFVETGPMLVQNTTLTPVTTYVATTSYSLAQPSVMVQPQFVPGPQPVPQNRPNVDPNCQPCNPQPQAQVQPQAVINAAPVAYYQPAAVVPFVGFPLATGSGSYFYKYTYRSR